MLQNKTKLNLSSVLTKRKETDAAETTETFITDQFHSEPWDFSHVEFALVICA